MPQIAGKTYCPECKNIKKDAEFYKSNNKEKYVTGRLPICKVCRSMMVNNWDSSTFTDILEECDVPWIPQEWNKLLESYGQDVTKCGPMTIIGRYLSKMQLVQHNKERWADSDKIQQRYADEIRMSMEAQGFEEDVIVQAIEDNKRLLPGPGIFIDDILPKKNLMDTDRIEPAPPIPLTPNIYTNPYFIEMEESLSSKKEEEKPSINDDGTINNQENIVDYFANEFDNASYENDLTIEDKKYLRLKWGKTYSTDDLIRLEKLYKEMEESFDIQNASHKDTLVKACKASLKSDQLLDIGDVENSQKMIRIYETLMKMGKFTAVQNKEEQGECLNSISEMVLMCEKEGFIPRYYIDGPKDKVDETIADLKEYTRDLFNGESNLETMIEAAIKQMYEQENKVEDDDEEDEINFDNVESIVKDTDFVEYGEFIEQEEEMSEEAIKEFLKEVKTSGN